MQDGSDKGHFICPFVGSGVDNDTWGPVSNAGDGSSTCLDFIHITQYARELTGVFGLKGAWCV